MIFSWKFIFGVGDGLGGVFLNITELFLMKYK